MNRRALVVLVVGTAAAIVAIWSVFDHGDREEIPSAGMVSERASEPPTSAELGEAGSALAAAAAQLSAQLAHAVAMSLGRFADLFDAGHRGPVDGARLEPASRLGAMPPVGKPTAHRLASKRDAPVPAMPYRPPVTGQRTILTSGHRIGPGVVKLPSTAVAQVAQLTVRDRAIRSLVCVNRGGVPSEVRVENGTGVDRVDAYVARRLLGERYRPVVRDGRPVPFCERVTIVVAPR
jgi:hypothetical protein